MKRMKLCLLVLPLLGAAAAQAQDHREGREGRDGSRWATSEPDRGRREQAPPRNEQRNDMAGRGDARDGRDGRRDDNRRNEPPRTWASPPRDQGNRDHDRRPQTWNRDMYQRDYWRNDRNNYYRYPSRTYGYYDGRGYNNYYRDPRYYDRGYNNHRRWSRGDRLPFGYYDRSRWERDYWRYDLYDPRDGCGWVRNDGDALLVVLASGLVLDAVYDVFR